MSIDLWLLALGLTLPMAALALVIGRTAPALSGFWTAALILTVSPLLLTPLLLVLPGEAQAALEPFAPLMLAQTNLPLAQTERFAEASQQTPWLAILFTVWVLGALFRAGFECRRSIGLAHLSQGAQPADEALIARVNEIARRAGDGPVRLALHDGPVLVTGLLRPRLLLNVQAARSPILDEIVRHELSHLRRHDIAAMALVRALGVAVWFNPFWFALEARRRLAAELACDRQALKGRSLDSVRLYARALLSASHSNSGSRAVVGFGVAPRKALEMRMTSVLTPSPKPQRVLLGFRVCLLGAAAALLGGVQAANALGELSAPDFTAVVLEGRDTVGFGPHRIEGLAAPRFHGGHDIAAALGSPVRAPAAGRITYAGNEYNGNADWGYVVEIDHGGGWTTVFAHLSGSMYGRGEVLEAGQIFATVGLTGRTTGPHLHVEVRENGERRDPAEHLPGLARLTD